MIDWPELTLFLFVTARVSGFILFNPILGRANVPAAFRSGMALVLSVFVMSMSEQQPPDPSGVMEFAVLMLLEMAIGFLLGMAVNFFFYIPQLAGTVIDTQMGMTMNQMYDPGASANLSVSGRLLNTLMMPVSYTHLTLPTIGG